MTDLYNKRIIPDSVLEHYYCNVCYKYLTVGPIGVYNKGGNICGRCLYGKKHAPKSLFEYDENFGNPNTSYGFDGNFPLALFGYASISTSLFPCVNRFEGCNKLLPFSGIKQHENNCNFKSYICPLCPYKGIGSQLIQHYKISHRKFLILDDRSFYLTLRESLCETYLYKIENMLFFVKVQYIEDITQFLFDTLCLGSSAKTARIRLGLKVPKFDDFFFISDNLRILENISLNLTIKVNNVHLTEANNITCNYKMVLN